MLNRQQRILSTVIIGIAAGVLYSTIREFYYLLTNAQGLALPNGKPLGGDFACFYIAGKLLRTQPFDLYNFSQQLALQKAFFAGQNVQVGFLPFVYPPLVAWIFAGLSTLSFPNAVYLWLAASGVLAVAAIVFVLRKTTASPVEKCTIALVALAFVPFSIDCLASGQTSVFGLLIFALVYYFKRCEKDFWAGVVFAFSYYKPPLFFLFLIFALRGENRRFFGGFLLCGSVLIATTLMLVGFSGLEQFLVKAIHYQHGVEMLPGYVHTPTMGAGPLSTLLLFFPETVALPAYLLMVALLYALTPRPRAVPTPAEKDLLFAAQSAISVFSSVWLMIYDYTLLIVPLMLVAAHFRDICSQVHRRLLFCASALLFFEYLFRDFHFGQTVLKLAPFILFGWILLLVLTLKSEQKRSNSER